MKTYKGFIIKINPLSPTLYTVAVEGRGGKIPRNLEGSFTSVATVIEIIDKYLDNKKGTAKNDSQTDPTE